MRFAIAMAAAAAAALALSATAPAHVTVNPPEWAAEGFARFAIRVRRSGLTRRRRRSASSCLRACSSSASSRSRAGQRASALGHEAGNGQWLGRREERSRGAGQASEYVPERVTEPVQRVREAERRDR